MVKDNRKLLPITILLLLVSSIAYVGLVPNAYAAETTNQEKGLSILNNVVGLDLSKYTVTTNEYPQQKGTPALYLDVVPQESIGYDLTSGESKLKMLYTFADGHLQMIHVLETKGQPSLTKQTAVNAVEMAKDFLANYQTYTADSLYGELKSTLENVNANRNITRISGNTQLEITANDGYTTFKWTYTFNGIITPSKFVSLGFKDGFLAAFVDNWQFYKIGSTNVNLSEKEANIIALETTKSHSWSVNLDDDAFDAKNFDESNVVWSVLVFDGSLGANKPRGEDVLTLYPVWRVGVALDKWYGNLYGIEVDVWADTKEARSAQEAWSTITPQEEMAILNASTVTVSTSQAPMIAETKTSSIMWIALPALAVAMTGATVVWLSKKKNLNSYTLPKLHALKTGGTLLCVLMFSVVLLIPVATVNATGGAVVWGSESTGQVGYWRKSSSEITLQRYIANNLQTYFAYNGYNAYNHQGSGSTKYNILYNDLPNLQSAYNRVAVVDFNHGVGSTGYSQAPGEWHYMFEDNTGTVIGPPGTPPNALNNGVYDMDIYPRVNPSKIIFAFINTCLSANNSNTQGGYPSWWGMVTYGARGMP
jgi:hypothetical protein